MKMITETEFLKRIDIIVARLRKTSEKSVSELEEIALAEVSKKYDIL